MIASSERLLKSDRYGERWARIWLDLARYSDTNGYEKDRQRSIWAYRDWVIRALNEDMPFDRFTVEQLAGDMLPNATASQRIATGFHRNTMLNEEAESIRWSIASMPWSIEVATTGTVWMGLTTGCAQCHSHKYDPISHQDYYRLMALMDNADEPDLAIKSPDVVRRRAALVKKIAQLEADLPNQFPAAPGKEPLAKRRQMNLDKHFAGWLAGEKKKVSRWSILRPTRMKTNLPKLKTLSDGSILSTGDITKRDVFTLTFDLSKQSSSIAALRLEALPDERLPAGGPGRAYYEGRKGTSS